MTDARSLTHRLGGAWRGGSGNAPCPVCQQEGRRDQNALTLANGADERLLLHCKKSGCGFTDILAALGVRSGDYRPPDPAERARREAERKADIAKRSGQARRLWDEAAPTAGTLAETYLREARGVTCDLPETLRFHPACWHGSTATRHPAMVALVEGGGGLAVHRTFLRRDGSGKAAIEPCRAMLGPAAGGAVRIAEASGALAVTEGIETALSLASGILRVPATVWSALSTSGLRSLRLPPMPSRLIIASDGDAPGRAAAYALAERAHTAGWRVEMFPAPEGRDWADMLREWGDAA